MSIKITVVDTKFSEMKQYTEETFSLNFILGRDIPFIVVIFSEGKDHFSANLNDVFKGTGCSINDFEDWYINVLEYFKESLND